MTLYLMRMLMFGFLTLFAGRVGANRFSDLDWPEYGGTLEGQRYSTRTQITPANVKQLEIAWTFHTHTLDTPSSTNWRQSFEVTPVIWNGSLYFDTPFDEIFAVNGETGKEIWRYDPQVNRESQIYNATSRGVSLWHATHASRGTCGHDRVFVATLDRRLIARDAKTGAPCLGFGSQGTVDLSKGIDVLHKDFYGFTSPVTVVGDIVVIGSLVADNQYTFVASGAVRGFNAVTGKLIWIWEPLRNNNKDLKNRYGSANTWSIISADTKNDLVFLPTGSASVDYFGGLRKGDNRDANSLVALRASTGQRVWAYQLIHHDIWDYDIASQPVLFNFRKDTPAVAITTKTNMLFVFNRLTGEPLYPIKERPVPKSDLPGEEAWPTQPFSSLPPLAPLEYSARDLHFRNQEENRYCQEKLATLKYAGLFTPPSIQGSLIYPGSIGGANWGSSAFNPQTGILYTRVSRLPFAVRQVPHHNWAFSRFSFLTRLHDKYYDFAPRFLGGDPPRLDKAFRTPDSGGAELDYSPQAGAQYKLARTGILTPSGLPCAPEPFGSLVAINLNSGQKLWSVPHGAMGAGGIGSIGVGGPLVTAGGLVFVASTNDPFLRAYSSTSGGELARLALPVSANATPMSYEIAGRQFVVVASGGHGAIGNGQGDEIVAYALPSRLLPTKTQRNSRRVTPHYD